MDNLKKQQIDLIIEIRDLSLELKRMGVKKDFDISLNHLNLMELEQQRNNLLSFAISNEVNNTLYNIENSIKDGLFSFDDLLCYEKSICECISKIKYALDKGVDFNNVYFERFCSLIYKVIKYFIYSKIDVSNLLDKVKSVYFLSDSISFIINRDLSYVRNFQDVDNNHLVYLLEKCKSDLLDEELIQYIINIQLNYRKERFIEISEYSDYLYQSNKSIYDKLEELENKNSLLLSKTNERSLLFSKVKKSFLSLILSSSILVGTFFGVSCGSCLAIDYYKQNIVIDKYLARSVNDFNNLKRTISSLLGIWASFIFSCFPEVGFREVKRKFKNLEKQLMESDFDINSLYLSISLLKNEIDFITLLDEDVVIKIREVLNDMYRVLGYFYVSSEEREFVNNVKATISESLVLRNISLDL